MENENDSKGLIPQQQQLEAVDHLSEEAIKQVTLRYLKGYYKYRPTLAARPLEGGGYLAAKLGVQTAGGIIADGYLSYRTADESQFEATFEATSYLTRGEVRFRPQWLLLSLDSLAVGISLAAVAFGTIFILNLLPIRDFEIGGNLAGLTVLTLLIGGLYSWLLKGKHRYRYIYAVEQFKKYHANEQWIAVAEDVFEGAKDKYRRELQEQCVRNGFGLIFIQKDFKPLLFITPARRELFENQRDRARFLPQAELGGRLTRQMRNSATRLIPKQLQSLELWRYRRNYFYQIVIIAIAIAIISVVFTEAWKKKDIVIYETEAYIQELENMNLPRENYFYGQELILEDTLDWPHLQPFLDVQSPYREDFKNGFSSRESLDERYYPALPPPDQFIDADTISNVEAAGLIITSQGRIVASYDCSRLRGIKSDKFLIQDSQHKTLASAIERINQLGFYNFSANALWIRCFLPNGDGYLVFLDFLFEDRQQALLQLNEYGRLLEEAGLYDNDLIVRRLQDF